MRSNGLSEPWEEAPRVDGRVAVKAPSMPSLYNDQRHVRTARLWLQLQKTLVSGELRAWCCRHPIVSRRGYAFPNGKGPAANMVVCWWKSLSALNLHNVAPAITTARPNTHGQSIPMRLAYQVEQRIYSSAFVSVPRGSALGRRRLSPERYL